MLSCMFLFTRGKRSSGQRAAKNGDGDYGKSAHRLKRLVGRYCHCVNVYSFLGRTGASHLRHGIDPSSLLRRAGFFPLRRVPYRLSAPAPVKGSPVRQRGQKWRAFQKPRHHYPITSLISHDDYDDDGRGGRWAHTPRPLINLLHSASLGSWRVANNAHVETNVFTNDPRQTNKTGGKNSAVLRHSFLLGFCSRDKKLMCAEALQSS